MWRWCGISAEPGCAGAQVAAAFKQSFEVAANSFIQQVGHVLAAPGRKMLDAAVADDTTMTG
jgi:hypothetical protein